MAQSKNVGRMLAQLGEIPPDSPMNLDDLDVIEEYGLDLSLAYTDDINEAALQANRDRQVRDYVGGGLPEGQAKQMANKQMAEARKVQKQIKDRWMKNVGSE